MRRRRDSCRRVAVFSLGLFLMILLQICSPSTAEEIGASRRSPGRKARFFSYATTSYNGTETASSLSSESINYGEEKRLVHTGPNPLHN